MAFAVNVTGENSTAMVTENSTENPAFHQSKQS